MFQQHLESKETPDTLLQNIHNGLTQIADIPIPYVYSSSYSYSYYFGDDAELELESFTFLRLNIKKLEDWLIKKRSQSELENFKKNIEPFLQNKHYYPGVEKFIRSYDDLIQIVEPIIKKLRSDFNTYQTKLLQMIVSEAEVQAYEKLQGTLKEEKASEGSLQKIVMNALDERLNAKHLEIYQALQLDQDDSPDSKPQP